MMHNLINYTDTIYIFMVLKRIKLIIIKKTNLISNQLSYSLKLFYYYYYYYELYFLLFFILFFIMYKHFMHDF